MVKRSDVSSLSSRVNRSVLPLRGEGRPVFFGAGGFGAAFFLVAGLGFGAGEGAFGFSSTPAAFCTAALISAIFFLVFGRAIVIPRSLE